MKTSINVIEVWPPMETSPEEPIVKSLLKSVHSVTGLKPEIYGKAAGTDASWLVRDAKIPTPLFGPGDPRFSHAPNEFVDLENVTKAAKVFAVLAMNVLGVE
jgi:acetylornithine deacetylase